MSLATQMPPTRETADDPHIDEVGAEVGHLTVEPHSDVVQDALSLHKDIPTRFRLSGSSLFIGPSAALMLGLMMHELATNATKYGALSTAAA